MTIAGPWCSIVMGTIVLCCLHSGLAGAEYDGSDLVGTWELHSLWAGPRTPFWDRGSLTVGSDGAFTFLI